MFESGTVTEHLLRGALGFSALGGATVVMLHGSLWSVPLALGSIAVLRGCPTCWTIGLFETLTTRATKAACRDGSCTPSPRSRVVG